jgi:hypothetical protein
MFGFGRRSNIRRKEQHRCVAQKGSEWANELNNGERCEVIYTVIFRKDSDYPDTEVQSVRSVSDEVV